MRHATLREQSALVRWRVIAREVATGARDSPAGHSSGSVLRDRRGDPVQGEGVQRLRAFVLGPQVTGTQGHRSPQPGQGRAVRIAVPDPDLGLFPYRLL